MAETVVPIPATRVMTVVPISAARVMETLSLKVVVTGARTQTFRLRLASFLFRLAARVLGVGQIQLTFDQ